MSHKSKAKLEIKVLSVAKTINFPIFEWRGTTESSDFIIRYNGEGLYLGMGDCEISAALNIKKVKPLKEYPNFVNIAKHFSWTLQDGFDEFE